MKTKMVSVLLILLIGVSFTQAANSTNTTTNSTTNQTTNLTMNTTNSTLTLPQLPSLDNITNSSVLGGTQSISISWSPNIWIIIVLIVVALIVLKIAKVF